ncbi:MAG: DUF2304 domain-containing protein [Actinomycetota bacterium]|nr:DUF2304 domain-containing protein [Actinomycetota bacterium]
MGSLPTLPRALSILLSLGLLGLIASMLRRRKLREKYVALWIVVGLAATVLSIWPAALVSISNSLGFQVPSNFLFFVDGLLLLLVSIQLSAEVSKLEDRTEVIAQELAIISMRLAERHRQAGAGPEQPDPQDPSASFDLQQGQADQDRRDATDLIDAEALVKEDERAGKDDYVNQSGRQGDNESKAEA